MSDSKGMPITISTTIMIESSIAQVWDVLRDYAAYCDWNPYIVAIDGAAQPGSTITVHARHSPDAVVTSAVVLVVSCDPHLMRWEGGAQDRSVFKGDHVFSLMSEGASLTRLDHHEHFSGTSAGALLEAHGTTIEANFMRFNQALKRRCETGL